MNSPRLLIVAVSLGLTLFLALSRQILNCPAQVCPPPPPQEYVRHVVVGKPIVQLYDSVQFDNPVAELPQWAIFELQEEGQGYYVILNSELQPNKRYYLRQNDAFIWNTKLSLCYLSSPHETDRAPAQTYHTLEGARTQSGLVLFEELSVHETDCWQRTLNSLVLQEPGQHLYRVAKLYEGGNLPGVGYVRFQPGVHGLRRYVSRQQLIEQWQNLLSAVEVSQEGGITSGSQLDKIYGFLDGFLYKFFPDAPRGARDISRMLGNDETPEIVEQGVFADEILRGGRADTLAKELLKMQEQVEASLGNDAYWSAEGYSFVPIEWMDPNLTGK